MNELAWNLITDSDRTNDAVFLIDLQRRVFRYVNDYACQKLGYTRDELLQMGVADIDPFIDEMVFQKIDNQIKTKGFFLIETYHRTKDGRLFPVEVTGHVFEYNGELLGISIARDITERKQKDNQFTLLNYAFDNVEEAIFLVDENARFIQVNERACSSLGYSREELLTLQIFDIDPDFNFEHWEQYKAARLLGGPHKTIETRHKTKEGRIFPVEVRGTYFTRQGKNYNLSLVRDISERKETEKQLRLLNHALNHIHESIWLIGHDAKIHYINEKVCHDTGLARDELLTLTIPDVDPDFPLERWSEHWQALKEKGSITLESSLKTKNGHISPIEVNANYFEFDGESYNLAFVRDITERKATKRQLALLNYALDHVGESAWLIDENTKFHYNNAEACRAIGYTREELLHLGVPDIDLLYQLEVWPEHWQDLKTHGSLTFESLHKTKDGRIFPVEINANYFEFDGQGYNLALIRDITERKQTQSALQRSENLLADAQRIAHIGSWEVDFSSGIVNWSDEQYRIWEMEKSQFGATVEAFYETVHPEDLEKVAKAYSESVANKTSYQVEHRLLLSDGRIKYIAECGEPFLDENGEIVRFVGTSMDITEQQHIKNTLEFIAQRGWKDSSELFLHALAQYLAQIFGVDYVIIDKVGTILTQAETVALYVKGDIVPNMLYDLKGTPCDGVMNGKLCAHPRNIQQLFPDDLLLVEMQVESYAGLPLWNTSGDVIGLIAVMDTKPMHDITFITSILQLVATSVSAELERQRSEQVLLDAHHFLKQVVNTLADPVFVKDRQHRWILLNQAFCQFIGHPLEQLIGKSDYDFFPEEQANVFWAKDEEVFFNGDENINEEKFTDSAGVLRTIITKKTCYTDSNGQQFLVGIITDITERKRMEDELAIREKQFRVLAETLPSPVFRFDRDCRRIYVNPMAEKISGIPATELLYKKASDVSPLNKEELEKVEQIIQHVLNTGEPQEGDVLFRVPLSGQIYYFHNNYAPEFDANGNVASVIVVSHDITERKRMEDIIRLREQEFRVLVETSPAPIIRYDANCRRVYVNPAVEKISGKTAAELIDHAPVEGTLLDKPVKSKIERILRYVLKTGRITAGEVELVFPDGKTHYFYNRYAPEIDANGKPVGVVLVGHDITAHKKAEKLLVQREREFRSLAENIPDCVTRYDAQCHTTYMNPAMLSSIAPEALPIIGETLIQSHPDNPATIELHHFIEQIIKTGKASEIEIVVPNRGSELRTHLIRGVAEYDHNGKFIGVLAIGNDVTERKQMEQQMFYHASYDSLTGLPNRRMLNNRIREEIARAERNHVSIAMLFVDLDRFKEVNDTLGHEIGDCLLVEAAQRIRNCIRASDTVARLGGDEFVIILSSVGDVPPLERVTQSILVTLAQPFYFGYEYSAYISASIGIAVYPQDANDAESLIGCADQAMYAAKESGRNNFSFFTASMQEQAHQRLQLIGSLREALDKNQFEVYYQPITCVVTGKPIKAEALVRWHHPELGMVSPALFIPLAEETDLIQDIGSWVFRQAADTAKRWNELSGDDEHRLISINMSPRQLTKGIGDQMAINYLQEIELDSAHIVVEITEGLLLDDSPDIIEKLERLRMAGIQISLDDFGTGYSAMAYLKKFNLDYLKIDQSFVRGMETDLGDHAITEAIIMMAHRLGLQVIAEGVETEGQRKLLAEAGCEYIQGYLYSKPLPIDAFLSYVLK